MRVFIVNVVCVYKSQAIDSIAKMHSAYLGMRYDITFLTNSNLLLRRLVYVYITIVVVINYASHNNRRRASSAKVGDKIQ